MHLTAPSHWSRSIGTGGRDASERVVTIVGMRTLPAVFQFQAFAAAGGLMSYGGSLVELYRQSGLYAGRILKGERPGNLPVQQVTKVELIINLRAAKELNVEVPPALLARADEVIE